MRLKRAGGLPRAREESLRRRRRSGARSVSRTSQERLDDARVELRAGALAEPPHGLLDRKAPAVGPVGRHRVERVADEDDARLERNLLARQPVGIAARRRSARGSGGRSAGRRRAARSERGSARRARDACSMTSRSSVVSGPGFRRISDGMPIFPMSWKSAPSSRRFSAFGVEPELAADLERHVGDRSARATTCTRRSPRARSRAPRRSRGTSPRGSRSSSRS